MPTMAEILDQARIDLDDPEEPGNGDDTDSRWKNRELCSYFNRAIDEACLRSRLLVDTAGIDADSVPYGQVPILAGQAEYTLDPRVIKVLRAKLVSGPIPLQRMGRDDLDYQWIEWENVERRPIYYIQDMDHRKIRLVPEPVENDTLILTVQRLELSRFAWPADMDREPEMHIMHHWEVLHWIKHLAYSKRDPDTYDKKRAREEASIFAEFFGRRDTAWELEEQRAHRNLRVRGRFK